MQLRILVILAFVAAILLPACQDKSKQVSIFCQSYTDNNLKNKQVSEHERKIQYDMCVHCRFECEDRCGRTSLRSSGGISTDCQACLGFCLMNAREYVDPEYAKEVREKRQEELRKSTLDLVSDILPKQAPMDEDENARRLQEAMAIVEQEKAASGGQTDPGAFVRALAEVDRRAAEAKKVEVTENAGLGDSSVVAPEADAAQPAVAPSAANGLSDTADTDKP